MPRRRGNGDNGLYEKPGRGWVGTVELPGSGRCRRKRKYFYGPTKEAVREKIRQWETGNNRTALQGGSTVFEAYSTYWLKLRIGLNDIRPRTQRNYASVLKNHLLPTLADVRLDKISRPLLESMFIDFRKTQSPRLMQLAYDVLSMILDSAVSDEAMPSNPARKIKRPYVDPKEQKHDTWSQDEALIFLDAAVGDRYEALYRLALSVGMRFGELAGLEWVHVDLANARLHVRQQLSDTLELAPPKTAKSIRLIELPKKCVEALVALKKEQFSSRARKSHLVFTDTNGGPIRASNFTKRNFKPLIAKAGVKVIRFHDLRHTAATLRLRSGDHPKVVSEMLGHTSIQITMDLYADSIPSLQRESADRFDAIL